MGPWWPQLSTFLDWQDDFGGKTRTHLASAGPAEGDLEEMERRDLSVDDELPRQGTAA